MHTTSIRVDSTKILTRTELAAVLAALHARTARSANTRLNLTLVRLACCCGLRASEIAALQVADVRCEVGRASMQERSHARRSEFSNRILVISPSSAGRRINRCFTRFAT